MIDCISIGVVFISAYSVLLLNISLLEYIIVLIKMIRFQSALKLLGGDFIVLIVLNY